MPTFPEPSQMQSAAWLMGPCGGVMPMQHGVVMLQPKFMLEEGIRQCINRWGEALRTMSDWDNPRFQVWLLQTVVYIGLRARNLRLTACMAWEVMVHLGEARFNMCFGQMTQVRTTAYGMLTRAHRHWCRAGSPDRIDQSTTPTQHWVSICYWKALIVVSRTAPEYTSWGVLLADYGFPSNPVVDETLSTFIREPIAPATRMQAAEESAEGLGNMMWFANPPQCPPGG